MNRPVLVLSALTGLTLAACSPVAGGFGESATTLRGRVVRADGQAAVGMKLHVRVAGGPTEVATTAADGSFLLAEPPLGEVVLLGHDGRGAGLLRDAALIDGGDNDLGELRLQPLADLPAMVTQTGLGLEERITTLTGDCLYPVFSPDHLFAYCLRTVGDSALVEVVEVDVTTGAARKLGDQMPFTYQPRCPGSPLRVEGQGLLVGSFDHTYAYPLAATGSGMPIRYLDGSDDSCDDGLDAIQQGPFVNWMRYRGDLQLSADRIDTTSASASLAAIAVASEASGLEVGRRRRVIATSPTHLAMRLNLRDPAVGASTTTANAIHIFDLVARTVVVAQASAPVERGAFVNGELRAMGPTGMLGFDAQGVERMIAPLETESVVMYAAERGDTRALAVLNAPGHEPRAWQIDFAQGTLVPYPELIDHGFSGLAYRVPADRSVYRGWRFQSDGTVTVAVAPAATSSTSAEATDLVEYVFRPDATVDTRLFSGMRDDGESGPVSRLQSPDASRTALLMVDPSTGFRQVHEGPSSAVVPAQRTFIAGSHTALDYSADGTALHFFALDPLSGYIQLFRLSAEEPAPSP